jgi:thioredoxin:protein disulfide reductase
MKEQNRGNTGRIAMGKILSTLSTLFLLGLSLGLSPAAWSQLDRPSISSFTQQNQQTDVPLPLEQAFPYYVSELSPGKYRINWTLAPGHYLYRHAFQFTLRQTEDGDSLPVDYELPAGIKKTDQFFGKIEAYYNQISVDLNLSTVPGPDAVLMIQYQGCAEWGFCYPPQRSPFKLLP